MVCVGRFGYFVPIDTAAQPVERPVWQKIQRVVRGLVALLSSFGVMCGTFVAVSQKDWKIALVTGAWVICALASFFFQFNEGQNR